MSPPASRPAGGQAGGQNGGDGADHGGDPAGAHPAGPTDEGAADARGVIPRLGRSGLPDRQAAGGGSQGARTGGAPFLGKRIAPAP